MTAKSKIWLLALVVAALGAGFIWKTLRHRDHPSNQPAVVASTESGEKSLSKGESTAASSLPKDAARPDSGALGGAIGSVIGGVPADARLQQASGVIVVYTPHVVVLASENKEKLEFDLPDAPGKAMTTAGLRKGDRVVVGYTEANGRKVANSISRVQVYAAAPAPAAEPKE